MLKAITVLIIAAMLTGGCTYYKYYPAPQTAAVKDRPIRVEVIQPASPTYVPPAPSSPPPQLVPIPMPQQSPTVVLPPTPPYPPYPPYPPRS